MNIIYLVGCDCIKCSNDDMCRYPSYQGHIRRIGRNLSVHWGYKHFYYKKIGVVLKKKNHVDTSHPSKIRASCMKKWYMAESDIFGISSSVRSIWHGSGILYRQLKIHWSPRKFLSPIEVKSRADTTRCAFQIDLTDELIPKKTTFSHVPFFHARCSNFRGVTPFTYLRFFCFYAIGRCQYSQYPRMMAYTFIYFRSIIVIGWRNRA